MTQLKTIEDVFDIVGTSRRIGGWTITVIEAGGLQQTPNGISGYVVVEARCPGSSASVHQYSLTAFSERFLEARYGDDDSAEEVSESE